MSKTVYQLSCGVKIYPIDYLCNAELTELDLNNLFDNNKKGLMYSLIIGMFKHINSKKKNYQIIKMITSNKNWMYNNEWTKNQRDDFENILIKIYKNIYQYKDIQAVSLAQWFMTIYGLSVEGNKLNLEK